MKYSKDLLSSVLQTAQMGQTGIRSLMDISIRQDLHQLLKLQLQEYERIETEAYAIAGQRGWEMKDLDPAIRFLTDRMIRMRLGGRDCDSKIADIMIRRNTSNMIRGLRKLHRYPRPDDRICAISQKLLDCETSNIQRLQSFL